MKNYLIIAICLTGAVLFSSCGPSHVMATRPADVIYTRPPAPGQGYVWINGDWYWRGNGYEWREGRWDRGRVGRSWNEGNWMQTRRGWKWNRGHWR
ncbi:MAG: YXWGXW repeat-containing protein [Chitinophagaceae bacterium]